MHPHTRLADLFAPAPARRPVCEALARRMPIARMMGLTLGDGTEIASVRLGDGTEIEEIRTGDGTVLWTGDAIPDSGDLHARFDWINESSTSEVTDQTGNGHHLTGTYTGPTETINGNQAGEFDGSDDILDVAFSAVSQPTHIFAVARFDDLSDNSVLFSGEDDSTAHAFFYQDSSDTWRVDAGDATSYSSSPDTDPHIFNILFDGEDTRLRIDGATIGTVEAGANPLDGLTVGANESGSSLFTGAIGEMPIYPMDKTSVEEDIEQYLSDKSGVSLA